MQAIRPPSLVRAAIFLAAFFIAAPDALAFSVGPTQKTNRDGGSGCAGCHGSAVNAGVSVAITGPLNLAPNASATYTVTVNRTITNGTKVGVNIATSDASMSLSVPGSQPLAAFAATRKLAHTNATVALKTIISNTASYTFNYTMPAAAAIGSTHTLYAVAQVGPSGSGIYNHAPDFTVFTIPSPPTSATASGPTATSVNLSWTGGGPEYRVIYKTGAVAPANPFDGTVGFSGAGTSTTVSGLSASTQYTFAVYSKNAAGNTFSASSANATATTTAAAAATRHVNAATGNNTANNCSTVGTPCKTITYAMSQAAAGNPGDTVSVAPGTYNLALGEVFPIVMKPGTKLIATGSPLDTVIDAQGDTVKQGILTSTGNASSAARLEGFSIRFGLTTAGQGGVALGGALRISGSSATFTVTRNAFVGNEARGYSADGSSGQTGGLGWGGAIHVFNSDVTITNNIFTGNVARGGNGQSHPGTVLTSNENGGPGEGGAIYFAGTGKVASNTFHLNGAVGGNGGTASNGTGGANGGTGGAISASGNPAPSIDNNIFSANAAVNGVGSAFGTSAAGALNGGGNSPSVQKNLFYANQVNGGVSTGDTLGTGSVAQNPLFHAPPNNLKIVVGSPAAGAGLFSAAPATDFDGVARPNPPAIGAYEPSALDPAGDFDLDGIPNGVEGTEGRNPLVKDNDVFTSARLFAMQQYRDFLGREGDAGGITFYTNGIMNGSIPRAQVIENFFFSGEFGGVVAPVTRLYFAFFNRIPDYPGLQFQVNAYRSGASLAAIANNFSLSPEFVATYGSLNNSQYVVLLYQNVLGRTPVQAEIDFHVNRLNTGSTRGEVMVGFSESPEYQNLKSNAVYVTNMYVGMLRRSPEQSGFDFWVAYMAGGNPGQALIAGFLQSAEYHNRFLP